MSGSPFSPLTAFKRRLILFAGLLLLLVWGLSLYDLWREYAEREASVRRQTAALSTALGDHVASLLQASDAALQGLGKGIRRVHPAGNHAIAEQVLVQQDERGGSMFSFAFFDAQGLSVAASEKGFVSGRNFADREYVRVHLQRPDVGLYVGEPLLGRTYGKRFLPVSRRVETEEGQLLGVLMTSLDAARIAEHFSRFDLGEHGAVALVHADGKVVARWPEFEKHFRQDISGAALFKERLPQAVEGEYEGVAATDGVRRLFHYRRLDSYPLVLVVAFARQDLVTGMRDDILAHSGLASMGSLLVIIGALLLWRAQRRTATTLASLERSEQRYHGLYDSIRDGIMMRDPEGHIIDCNQAYCDLLGYRREEIIGRPSSDFTPPGTYDAIQQRAKAQIEERGYCDEFEKEYVHRDGQRRFVRVRSWLMRDGVDEAGCYWAIVRDVTEQKMSEEQLVLARRIIESSTEAIMVAEADLGIVAINAAFEQVTGYSAAEVIGQTPRLFQSGRHDREFYAAMWRGLLDEGRWEGEVWDRRKDGEVFPAWVRINTIRDASGDRVTHYVAVLSDISERKAAEERIRFLAQHDPLTRLPNRTSLNELLRALLDEADPASERVAVLFIDLDNFKTINDSLGHQVGDAMLVEVARRLRHTVRQSDMVARLGGDEFVIVMPGVDGTDAVAHIARKVIDNLGGAYAIDGHVLHSTPSIGISFYPDDGSSGEELMRHADTAMYHAKASGRNNFQFFAKPMNIAANQRLVLENALWGAIGGDQLLLHYQPQVDMASSRIVGLEVLLRWRHPQLGMVSPADFIPVAEESGAIDPIGTWVLETACRQGRDWLSAGHDCGYLAVNISARQFRSPGFVDTVADILALTGFPADRLELEITETAVMASAESAALTMQRLRAMGIRLAIDDFGTGYSSLAYLHRFPVNRLKIDRSFVGGIPSDAAVTSLVLAIIALGDALGLELLAEGVETTTQAEFLLKRGCSLAQGFCFHRPLPATAVEALLSDREIHNACA